MNQPALSRDRKRERGMSLLETLVAASVMLIGITGVMALFMVVAATNQGQGTQATRCTEYAQDKMEQLMALNFEDAASNTAVIPVAIFRRNGPRHRRRASPPLPQQPCHQLRGLHHRGLGQWRDDLHYKAEQFRVHERVVHRAAGQRYHEQYQDDHRNGHRAHQRGQGNHSDHYPGSPEDKLLQ